MKQTLSLPKIQQANSNSVLSYHSSLKYTTTDASAPNQRQRLNKQYLSKKFPQLGSVDSQKPTYFPQHSAIKIRKNQSQTSAQTKLQSRRLNNPMDYVSLQTGKLLKFSTNITAKAPSQLGLYGEASNRFHSRLNSELSLPKTLSAMKALKSNSQISQVRSIQSINPSIPDSRKSINLISMSIQDTEKLKAELSAQREVAESKEDYFLHSLQPQTRNFVGRHNSIPTVISQDKQSVNSQITSIQRQVEGEYSGYNTKREEETEMKLSNSGSGEVLQASQSVVSMQQSKKKAKAKPKELRPQEKLKQFVEMKLHSPAKIARNVRLSNLAKLSRSPSKSPSKEKKSPRKEKKEETAPVKKASKSVMKPRPEIVSGEDEVELGFIQTPRQMHQKSRKLIRSTIDNHVQCALARKRDVINKDDMYLILKNDIIAEQKAIREGKAIPNQEANEKRMVETPRLDDAQRYEEAQLLAKFGSDRQGLIRIKESKKEYTENMKMFGYPNEKLNQHVFNIQLKMGLKKKDFFFDKILRQNQHLLEMDPDKIDERMRDCKPFENIIKKFDQLLKGEDGDRPPSVPKTTQETQPEQSPLRLPVKILSELSEASEGETEKNPFLTAVNEATARNEATGEEETPKEGIPPLLASQKTVVIPRRQKGPDSSRSSSSLTEKYLEEEHDTVHMHQMLTDMVPPSLKKASSQQPPTGPLHHNRHMSMKGVSSSMLPDLKLVPKKSTQTKLIVKSDLGNTGHFGSSGNLAGANAAANNTGFKGSGHQSSNVTSSRITSLGQTSKLQVQNFQSIYHLAMQIKNNEKSKTKVLMKGQMPEELQDTQEKLLNEMSDNRKAFLAKHQQSENVDPSDNIYLESLVHSRRFDLIKKFKLDLGNSQGNLPLASSLDEVSSRLKLLPQRTTLVAEQESLQQLYSNSSHVASSESHGVLDDDSITSYRRVGDDIKPIQSESPEKVKARIEKKGFVRDTKKSHSLQANLHHISNKKHQHQLSQIMSLSKQNDLERNDGLSGLHHHTMDSVRTGRQSSRRDSTDRTAIKIQTSNENPKPKKLSSRAPNFQSLVMMRETMKQFQPSPEKESFIHVANADQFKEIKNVVDQYYGVQTKKMDEIDNIDPRANNREHIEIFKRRQQGYKSHQTRKSQPEEKKDMDQSEMRQVKSDLKKGHDNFKQVMNYATVLMRNDDEFIKKKRAQHEKQAGLSEKRKNVFSRLQREAEKVMEDKETREKLLPRFGSKASNLRIWKAAQAINNILIPQKKYKAYEKGDKIFRQKTYRKHDTTSDPSTSQFTMSDRSREALERRTTETAQRLMIKQLEINIKEKLKNITEENLDELIEKDSFLATSEEENSEDDDALKESSISSSEQELPDEVKQRIQNTLSLEQAQKGRRGVVAQRRVQYRDKVDEAIQLAKVKVMKELLEKDSKLKKKRKRRQEQS